ncbi:MAG: MoaD/ThiS family protein [Candidatus Eisenbacteria bacterium]|uniref:Molybdopterin synthase sulfur carrier subunit n=1 Tax=Eiseniibacteriota bacterium TaxID=2212470 RepID=A0A933SCC0_UNCEI|nr:MoaD/ThiS family protein [Candidatus Eisenbacteria bacterium]
MQLNVLFFAQARERAGVSSAILTLPEGACVRDALDALVREHADLAPLRAHLAVAQDGVLVRAADALRDGAELALLPPVSGG